MKEKKNAEPQLTINSINQSLNQGIMRTPEELEKSRDWLFWYYAANDTSLKELSRMCQEQREWFLKEIFG